MYDDYYYDRPESPVTKHSGLGIASFIITLGSGVLLFLLVLIAGVLENAGRLDDESPMTAVLGLVMIGVTFVDVLGLILGIIGLCLPNRNKIFALLGVVVGVLVAFAFLCILIVGMLATA